MILVKFYIFAVSFLNYQRMDLQVIVFLNQTAKSNESRIFDRIIRVPVGVEPPYSSLVSVMKFLFGVGAVVSFQVL